MSSNPYGDLRSASTVVIWVPAMRSPVTPSRLTHENATTAGTQQADHRRRPWRLRAEERHERHRAGHDAAGPGTRREEVHGNHQA
jgi:hypothetical protein